MSRADTTVAAVEQLLAEHAIADVEGNLEATKQLAAALQVTLPSGLERYFQLTRGAAPRFLPGTDCDARVLAARTRETRAMLAENGLVLPRDAVVIASHQGYDVTWVNAGAGNASRVYGYCEGDAASVERFACFVDWLGWALTQ